MEYAPGDFEVTWHNTRDAGTRQPGPEYFRKYGRGYVDALGWPQLDLQGAL